MKLLSLMAGLLLTLGAAASYGAPIYYPLQEVSLTGTLSLQSNIVVVDDNTVPSIRTVNLKIKTLLQVSGYENVDPATTRFFTDGSAIYLADKSKSPTYVTLYVFSAEGNYLSQGKRSVTSGPGNFLNTPLTGELYISTSQRGTKSKPKIVEKATFVGHGTMGNNNAVIKGTFRCEHAPILF